MRRGVRPRLRELTLDLVEGYAFYLDTIRPRTEDDVLRRWVFAFLSIHTQWKSNVRGYQALADLGWVGRPDDLEQRLRGSGVGMWNTRTRALHSFADRFQHNPGLFRRVSATVRSELAADIYGIGLAKTSFAHELINPTANVVCLDVHTLRWITGSDKLNGNMTPEKYRELERRWVRACQDFGYPPVAARHALWDKQQGHTDSRYWSHVFES